MDNRIVSAEDILHDSYMHRDSAGYKAHVVRRLGQTIGRFLSEHEIFVDYHNRLNKSTDTIARMRVVPLSVKEFDDVLSLIAKLGGTYEDVKKILPALKTESAK